MHDTAHKIGGLCLRRHATPASIVVELGAMNVNGTLRDTCPPVAAYIGLDMAAGPGVDVVIKPNAPLPLVSASADIVIASSVFEHDLYFWETFLELVRIVKPGGVLYINAPSNGLYHRYPVDNWRFYPDCGKVLESWGRRHNYPLRLLESFVAEREGDLWNDFVAVFLNGTPDHAIASRLLCNDVPCTNLWRFDHAEVLLAREASEDMVLLARSREQAEALRKDRAPEAASLLAAVVPLWRRLQAWLSRKEARPNLIPHINVAFPHIAARLTDPTDKLDGLSQEIRRLLDLYVAAWPFDAGQYLASYADVAEGVRSGRIGSAWEHFRRAGYLEGRLPITPQLDRDWYLATYPDLAAAAAKDSLDIERHFLTHAYREGRLPAPPRIDTRWYTAMYLPQATDTPSLCAADFVPQGYRAGRLPAPPIASDAENAATDR